MMIPPSHRAIDCPDGGFPRKVLFIVAVHSSVSSETQTHTHARSMNCIFVTFFMFNSLSLFLTQIFWISLKFNRKKIAYEDERWTYLAVGEQIVRFLHQFCRRLLFVTIIVVHLAIIGLFFTVVAHLLYTRE